jgi:hypothetical protein
VRQRGRSFWKGQGKDLQGSDDNSGRHRSLGSSQYDPRTESAQLQIRGIKQRKEKEENEFSNWQIRNLYQEETGIIVVVEGKK